MPSRKQILEQASIYQKGKKVTITADVLKVRGRGLYCITPFDNLDFSKKDEDLEKGYYGIFKVGCTSRDIHRRINDYFTYLPQGVHLFLFLLRPYRIKRVDVNQMEWEEEHRQELESFDPKTDVDDAFLETNNERESMIDVQVQKTKRKVKKRDGVIPFLNKVEMKIWRLIEKRTPREYFQRIDGREWFFTNFRIIESIFEDIERKEDIPNLFFTGKCESFLLLNSIEKVWKSLGSTWGYKNVLNSVNVNAESTLSLSSSSSSSSSKNDKSKEWMFTMIHFLKENKNRIREKDRYESHKLTAYRKKLVVDYVSDKQLVSLLQSKNGIYCITPYDFATLQNTTPRQVSRLFSKSKFEAMYGLFKVGVTVKRKFADRLADYSYYFPTGVYCVMFLYDFILPEDVSEKKYIGRMERNVFESIMMEDINGGKNLSEPIFCTGYTKKQNWMMEGQTEWVYTNFKYLRAAFEMVSENGVKCKCLVQPLFQNAVDTWKHGHYEREHLFTGYTKYTLLKGRLRDVFAKNEDVGEIKLDDDDDDDDLKLKTKSNIKHEDDVLQDEVENQQRKEIRKHLFGQYVETRRKHANTSPAVLTKSVRKEDDDDDDDDVSMDVDSIPSSFMRLAKTRRAMKDSMRDKKTELLMQKEEWERELVKKASELRQVKRELARRGDKDYLEKRGRGRGRRSRGQEDKEREEDQEYTLSLSDKDGDLMLRHMAKQKVRDIALLGAKLENYKAVELAERAQEEALRQENLAKNALID